MKAHGIEAETEAGAPLPPPPPVPGMAAGGVPPEDALAILRRLRDEVLALPDTDATIEVARVLEIEIRVRERLRE